MELKTKEIAIRNSLHNSSKSKGSKKDDKDSKDRPQRKGLKNKKLEAHLRELWQIQKQVGQRKQQLTDLGNFDTMNLT